MTASRGRAIAYLRVSTESQADSGLGLDAQQAAIAMAAARLGLSLVQTFTDAGVSGGLPLEQRPGLLGAIDALASGDTLIIARRDRLGRDVLHVSMIQRLVERKGARIVSPDTPDDDSPTSVLIRQILDAFSQFERMLIRERTSRALAAKKARNQRAGHLAWGTQLGPDGIHLVAQADQLAILEEIRRLRHRGSTLIGICDALNERGLRNRAGTPFKPSHVAQLLARHGDGITLRTA